MTLETLVDAEKSALSRSQSNWIKGVLILLVVIDHNDFLRVYDQAIFRPFTFHVTGFFVIAFMNAYESKKSIAEFTWERLVRYGWPYFIFYTLYAIGANLLLNDHGQTLASYFTGLVFGSFELVKAGCGGAFMWFLPALLGFAIVVRLSAAADEKVILALIGSSALFHVFVAVVPATTKAYIPFGLCVVAYLIPTISLFFALRRSCYWISFNNSVAGIFVLMAVSIASYAYVVNGKYIIEVGAAAGPPANRFDLTILDVVCNISAISILYGLSRIFADKPIGGDFFKRIGNHSLQIYLLHPFFFTLSTMIIKKMGYVPVGIDALYAGVLTCVVSLLSSLFLSEFLLRFPKFRSAVFPANAKQLTQLIKFAT